jgi:hypothetical protein
MAKEKKIVYTANDIAIVKALEVQGDQTLAQLNESTGLKLVAGHIVGAMRKGLIAPSGQVEVSKPAFRKVNTYTFVTADPIANPNGKGNYNYTDGEAEVLKAAATFDGRFTLEELAGAMNLEKLSSGRINGLVKKGNIAKGDQVELASFKVSTVNTYALCDGISSANLTPAE